MHFKVFAGLLTAFHLVSVTWSYGTIVEVYPSTCPALPTVPSSLSMEYILAVLPIPVNIRARAHLSNLTTFVDADGETTTDCSDAAPVMVSDGRISSNGQFVSTTGLVPYSPFTFSSSVAAISTTFSVANNSYLAWNNSAFTDGQALFCVMDTTVQAVYDGQLPDECAQVNLAYVPTTLCPTFNPSNTVRPLTTSPTSTGTSSPLPTVSVLGSIRGRNATGNPLGCLNSSANSPAVLGDRLPRTVATLEECLDTCSPSAYFGVQSGFCVCGNTLASTATPAPFGSCNIPCSGNSAQNCGGANAMTVYSIVIRSGSDSTTGMSMTTATSFVSSGTSSTTATTSSMTSFVTSTGVPNCFERSPFDNTVNGGYLILCNTALPGFDLKSANGSSLFECIAACNAENAGPGNNTCVAVTFDIMASSNQCMLKTDVGIIIKGGEDMSEAAVIVFGANAPEISFASEVSTMSSTATTIDMSSMSSTSSASMAMTASDTTSLTATSSSTSSNTSSTTATSTSEGPRPTVTNPVGPLCPTYNGQVVSIGGSFYQVECSTDLVGETLIGNTTTASSLSECGGFCNLYNLAIPFGCVGVTLDTSSEPDTCYLKSSVTGTVYSALNDSLRLIYPGYPRPTDPILTAPSGSGSGSASSGTRTSTMTSTMTSSSTGPTATGPLCPAYDRQVLFFSSYNGNNYEVQCSTSFVANDLTPVVATSLTDCIDQCSFLNVNTETPQCIAVTFVDNPPTSPASNNCFPKSAVTTILQGVTSDDSARLIFSGYPSPMATMGTSSTPTRSLDSTAQSTSTSSTLTASSTNTITTTTSDPRTSLGSSTQTSSGTSVPSPTGSLCPEYSFQIIQAGGQQYEIECGYELLGRDIGFPYTPYPTIQSFQQCLAACNFWTENTATTCIAATYQAKNNECYLKDALNGRIPSLTFNAARLIYSGYPSITDNPTSAASTATATATGNSISTTSGSSSSSTFGTSFATASVYPPEPVCGGYNGGQLTSQGSNLYDISCNVDLRFGPSDLPPSGLLYADTFSACALVCDQYNFNANTQACRGFTWDSTSVGRTSFSNCFLKSNLIQTTTDNTANTIGVDSGRLLGPWPTDNEVILSKPIPLVTNTLYNGYSITYDYVAIRAPGDLNWTISDFADSVLYIGANGFVALSPTNLNNQAGLTRLSSLGNDNGPPVALPSNDLPPYVVAPYWVRGFATQDSQQGIYYQADLVSTGQYFISIEFYYNRWTTNGDPFHWITTYDTARPGIWTAYYFTTGAPGEGGQFQTVGQQGTATLSGGGSSPISAMYENGVAGSVNRGDKIVFNTNANVNTVVRTAGGFDAVLYGVPGSWSFTSSPP